MALWQTRYVISLLVGRDDAAGAAGEPGVPPTVEPLVVSTEADRRLDLAIAQLGGKGAFAKEVQAAVLDGRADLAVHSAKDLPSVTPPGLVVAAVLARDDPRDALVGARLDDLPPGARLGTGSPRRRAQLAWLRPDLTFGEVRGNVNTRLARLDAGAADALVLAKSGLERLGLVGRVTEVLEPAVMLPQVAQGILAVECREDDEATRSLLAALDDPPTRRAFDAERAFLVAVGGDCYLPAGAYARELDGGVIEVEGLLASLDGHVVLRHRTRGADPAAVGGEVARFLLDDSGGRDLLDR
jgi:hydroxymethylbilane synthase